MNELLVHKRRRRVIRTFDLQCPMQDVDDVAVTELLQCKRPTAGQQSILHFERRVLSGRTNQRHSSILDRPEKDILLALAKPRVRVSKSPAKC